MLTSHPKTLLAMATALPLVACGQAGEARADEDASGGSVLAVSAPLRTGLYRVVQTGDVDIEEDRCIDHATVTAGRFSLPSQLGEGWEIETNRMSGGKIEVAAHHSSGSRLTINGSHGVDSFSTTGTLELKLNGDTHVVRTEQHGTFASPVCEEGAA